MKYKRLLRLIHMSSRVVLYGIILQCFFGTLLLCAESSAQAVKSIKAVEVEVTNVKGNLIDVFNDIESRTDYFFAYDESDLDLSQTIKLKNGKHQLSSILLEISKSANLKFRQVNKQINVSPISRTENRLEIVVDEITVSGQVLSTEDGTGLPGVNVVIKGTTTGTTTDFEGNFEISVPDENTILTFSSIGFVTQEILVGNQTNISISLGPDIQALSEVVIVGYGTQKKSDLTGAVSTVSGDEIAKLTTPNATLAVQGRMAGVRVEANGGAPGSPSLVTIRGSGTLSDRQPLYVIDGMLAGSMNSLNTNDIESVTVLKDASATAIYGSRAANGVIVVTTKKGKAGQTTVEFDMNYGTQTPVKLIDWANAEQYAQVIRDGYDNDALRAGTTPTYTEDVGALFDPSIDSDMQDETLRNAPLSQMNVRVAGGGQNSTYSFSAGRVKQDGIVKQSSFERINARLNSTLTKGRFTFTEAIGYTRTVNNPNNYFNRERDIVPTIPIYDANGEFTATREDGATTHANPGNSLGVATVEDRTNTDNNFIGSLTGSFEILEGLVYKTNFGFTAGQGHDYTFTPEYSFSTGPTNGFNDQDRLTESNSTNYSLLLEHTLNFKKRFGSHNVDVLAGYSAQSSEGRNLGVRVNTFPNSNIINASQAETVEAVLSGRNEEGLISYFGRLNYSYDERYLFTATLRRDGSSLFAEDLRWGTFPSFAVGWNLSNEGFMSGVTAVTGIKLRASYGEMGSNNASPYVGDAVFNVNSSYPLGPGGQIRATGYSITSPVNSLLKWETTIITDIGVEFGILRDELLITLDYFKKESNDIIGPKTVAPWTGTPGTVPANVASVENTGFEFSADYRKKFGDLFLGVNANFTILDNKVTDIGNAEGIVGGGFTSNGRSASLSQNGLPIGAFWGLKVEGIYQSEQEAIDDGRYILSDPNDPNSTKIATAGAGDLNFQDIDGIPGLSDDDMQYLGSPIPDFEYGLNITAEYKGFDLSMLFNGITGNKILNGNIYRAWFEDDNNVFASMVDAWTPENPSTTLPRMTHQDLGQNGTRMSDFLLEDGSYFRLRNLVIGYTLPSAVTDAIKVGNVRVYLTSQNLFTFTDYTGYYPEVGRGTRDRGSSENIFNAGVDENSYPVAKTYQAGIQVSF